MYISIKFKLFTANTTIIMFNCEKRFGIYTVGALVEGPRCPNTAVFDSIIQNVHFGNV